MDILTILQNKSSSPVLLNKKSFDEWIHQCNKEITINLAYHALLLKGWRIYHDRYNNIYIRWTGETELSPVLPRLGDTPEFKVQRYSIFDYDSDYEESEEYFDSSSSSEWELGNVKPFKNLKGFTCFIDSIMYPILSTENPIKEFLMKPTRNDCITRLQKEFSNATNSCQGIMEVLINCGGNIANMFLENEPQDDGEFIDRLLSMYSSTSNVVHYTTPQDFFPYISLSPEKRSFIIYHIQRQLGTGKDMTPVIIPMKIEEYKLFLVTVHKGSFEGGHYTSYFTFGNDWYFYDDLAGVSKILFPNKEDLAKYSSLVIYVKRK